MPIYEYRCQDCQQIFEEWQTTFEERDLSCPVCGGTAKRIMSNTTFVLKGGGWYATDYASNNKASSGGNGNGNGNGNGKAKADADSGGEAEPDSKSEAKADAGSDGASCSGSCPPGAPDAASSTDSAS